MSILVRFDPTNVTAETYDKVNEQIKESGDWPPEGFELHVCFGSEGNLKVSEIWNSQQQFEAAGEHRMPILEEAGIEFAGEPEILEVHNIEKP
jgi:hypothetical protein